MSSINWSRWYLKYNANEIMTNGVITAESMYISREKLSSYMMEHNFVFVRSEHPFMDLIRNLKIFSNVETSHCAKTGWHKVALGVCEFCADEFKKQMGAITIQRMFRTAAWRARIPPLENVKAFNQTAMASSLPSEIVCKIAEQCFLRH